MCHIVDGDIDDLPQNSNADELKEAPSIATPVQPARLAQAR
jgi:hypothetical protein